MSISRAMVSGLAVATVVSKRLEAEVAAGAEGSAMGSGAEVAAMGSGAMGLEAEVAAGVAMGLEAMDLGAEAPAVSLGMEGSAGSAVDLEAEAAAGAAMGSGVAGSAVGLEAAVSAVDLGMEGSAVILEAEAAAGAAVGSGVEAKGSAVGAWGLGAAGVGAAAVAEEVVGSGMEDLAGSAGALYIRTRIRRMVYCSLRNRRLSLQSMYCSGKCRSRRAMLGRISSTPNPDNTYW